MDKQKSKLAAQMVVILIIGLVTSFVIDFNSAGFSLDFFPGTNQIEDWLEAVSLLLGFLTFAVLGLLLFLRALRKDGKDR